MHWTALHNAAIFKQIKTCKSTQTDVPVLLFFLASYNYTTLAFFSQNDVKQATGLPVSNIRRALNRLASDGFLLAKLKSSSPASQTIYALNPAFVFVLPAYKKKHGLKTNRNDGTLKP